ncbi:MAG: CoA-acylating methylmalonate-semialdehyde dehydrogenase [Myxococcales bacterium]|nr:CoA-acylating methylmalonate-semialdehyde dehydrogenase [Myxococcales bacterium]
MTQKLFVERLHNFIGGAWVASTGADHVALTNPATGEPVGSCPVGTSADVDAAVTAAKLAFPAWRDTPVPTRSRYLFDLRNLLEQNFEELARICTQEHGKTLSESLGSVRRGIDMVECGAGMPSLMMGKALEDISSGIDCIEQRQPMGVFAVIAPYNFPAMVPLWFLPFCLATGNTIIVKPSEQVPFSQHFVATLIDKLKLPPGVVNFVNGGKDVVNRIIEHPEIQGVSFVGSSKVAKIVYEGAAKTGKRVQALGGAKNFIVVANDCDWDKSVPNIVESCYGCAGQRCLAGATIIAIGDAYEPLVRKLKEEIGRLVMGNGLTPGVTLGPVISPAHKERVLAFVELGLKEGATLALDGRGATVPGLEQGNWVGPSLFVDVNPTMTIARDEIFGPVMCVLRATDLADAMKIVHAQPLANAASIYTSNGRTARDFVKEVPAAMVGVNIGVAAPMAFFTFGGSKGSFFGDLKAHGSDSVSFYTNNKTAIYRWH